MAVAFDRRGIPGASPEVRWPACRESCPKEGGLLTRLPRDVRWAMLAAVVVVLLSLYEEWPTVAMLIGLAFTGFIVARIISRD